MSYVFSKIGCETVSLSYHRQYNIEVVIARISYVYGLSMFSQATAISSFIECAQNGMDIQIKVPGQAKRDYIFIDDAVCGILTIAEKGVSGNIYNVSSSGDGGNYISIDEFAEEIVKVKNEFTDGKLNVLCEKSVGRPAGVILDNSKLKKMGWTINYPLRRGIIKMLGLEE